MQGSTNALVISSPLMYIVAKCQWKSVLWEENPDVFLNVPVVIKDYHNADVPASSDDKYIA